MKHLATTLIITAALASPTAKGLAHEPAKKPAPPAMVATDRQSPLEEIKIRLKMPLTTDALAMLPLGGDPLLTVRGLTELLSSAHGDQPEPKTGRLKKAEEILAGQSLLKLSDKGGKPLGGNLTATMKPEDIVATLNLPLFDGIYAGLPAAEINGEAVTLADLNKALASMHEDMQETDAGKRGYSDILDRLINVRVVAQEARTIGLDQLEEVVKPSEMFGRRKMREMLLARHAATVVVEQADIDKLYSARRSLWKLKSLQFKERDVAEKFLKKLSGKDSFDKLFEKAASDKSAIADAGKEFLGAEALHPDMLMVVNALKPGEVSGIIDLKDGFLIVKNLEKKVRDENPKLKEAIIKEELVKARAKSRETYKNELIASLAVRHDELIKSINFEAEKPGFAELVKDQRVLVEIKGGESITVAQLAESLKDKFFHGVEQAIKEKKVNKAAPSQIDEMVGNRVLDSEAKRLGLDKLPEFEREVTENTDMLLFGMFLERAVMPDVKYGKKDLEEYYEGHRSEYRVPDQYVLDSIPFLTAKGAEEAAAKLRQGMDFKWFKENAAGRVTKGKTTSFDTKGEMIDETTLPEEVQKGLTGAKPGEFRVYTGEKESYVIAVIDVIPERTLALNEVEGAVAKAVYSRKVNEAFEGWVKKLREQSDLRVYLDLGKQE